VKKKLRQANLIEKYHKNLIQELEHDVLVKIINLREKREREGKEICQINIAN
jgi:hypothetical protein